MFAQSSFTPNHSTTMSVARPTEFSFSLPGGNVAPTTNTSATKLTSTAAPIINRLSTRANVTATTFLPKHAPISSFSGGLHTGSSFGGAASSFTAAAPSAFDASLNVCYATAGGAVGSSELWVRSLLTPQQIKQKAQHQQQLADENQTEIDLSSIDPAPILTHTQLSNSGDISSIECLSDRLLIVGNGVGECTLVEISSQEHAHRPKSKSFTSDPSALTMRPIHTFNSLHSAATSDLSVQLSSSQPLVATCSEDGGIALLAPITRQVLRRIDHAHPSALQTIQFASSSTLYTAGMGSTIIGFDVRALSGGQTSTALSSSSSTTTPTKPIAVLSDPNAVSITSLALHPTRPHHLAVGSSNGCLSIFDLRSSSRPLCSIQAQRSAVWDCTFLPWNPSILAAASEDGSLCSFDFGASSDSASGFPAEVTFSLNEAETRMKPSKLYTHTTGGLNTLSVDRDSRTIVAGADGHALVVVNV